MSTLRWIALFATVAGCGAPEPTRRAEDPKPERPDPDPTTPTVTTPEPTTPPAPAVCDAGTDAWVQRVFMAVLGRKPHGAAEVAMWAQMADAHGRDTVVRALSSDREFHDAWEPLLGDMILVSRSGIDMDSTCFESPLLSNHDGSLARHIADNRPDAARYPSTFNMSDVVRDARVADRLHVIWQANLFARTNYVPFCGNSTDPLAIENERRLALGDEFLDVYLNRDLTCMGCHNSEFSVTDNADPALDRTWGVPALLEQALFETSAGPLEAESYYAVHRYDGVVRDFYSYGAGGAYPLTPWGMSGVCGEFRRYPASDEDLLSASSTYFGGPLDDQATLWDLEAMLGRGALALSGTNLGIGPDGQVASDEALAWMTASNIVDQVFELTMGRRLTIPYGFSRNEAQQQELQRLTEVFLAEEWSLRELLVAITTSEAFNAGLPETCGAEPYGLPPILDPYSVDDPDPAVRGNSAGDLVQRHTARRLLAATDAALEFPVRREYFTYFSATDEEWLLQASLGVMLQKGQAGFNGTDFQGALSWEAEYATCRDDDASEEFLIRAIRAASSAGATVEDLALAVKDRLVARGQWDSDEERDLVAALLDTPMDLAVSEADPSFVRNLGLFCGALTLSPSFFLTVEPLPSGPVPALDLGHAADCERLVVRMGSQGVPLTCNGWTPTTAP